MTVSRGDFSLRGFPASLLEHGTAQQSLVGRRLKAFSEG